MTDSCSQSVHLARWEEETGLARAFEAAWHEPPESGTVALVTRCSDEQGTLSERALPIDVIEAAARHLASRGASVRLILVPGDMDELEVHLRTCAQLEAAGFTVTTRTSGRKLALAGEVLGEKLVED